MARELTGQGLALSGGGYRASLFHLGVTRRLHELGILQATTRLSSVSGGSILAGFLAHRMLGGTLFNVGELAQAREHLEEGLALFHPRMRDDRLALRYTSDSAVFCGSFRGQVLWLQGFPDEARAASRTPRALLDAPGRLRRP